MEDMEIDPSEDVYIVNEDITIFLNKRLGEGSSGTIVFEGTYEGTQKVAVKQVRKSLVRCDKREIELLKKVNHENVVRYFRTADDQFFTYIVLELCDGTLKDFMNDEKYKFYHKKEGISTVYIGILEQIGKGLEHVHDSLNILHRDLKPSNVLIKFEKVSAIRQVIKAKISDFGISRQIKVADKCYYTVTESEAGSIGYRAPEVLRGDLHITTAIDIFAYGCIVHYVLVRRSAKEPKDHPFGPPKKQEDNIKRGNRHVFLSYRSPKSRISITSLEILADIAIQEMVNSMASKRPSIANVLKYPLFWSSTKQLQFIVACADVIKEDHFNDSVCKYISDWGKVLDAQAPNLLKEILKVQGNKDTYDKLQIYKQNPYMLLRCMRNLFVHFQEKITSSPTAKELFGEHNENVLDFFKQLFPAFFPLLWFVLRKVSYQNTDLVPLAGEAIPISVGEYYAYLEDDSTITVSSFDEFYQLSKKS